jgi:phage gp29-like protein
VKGVGVRGDDLAPFAVADGLLAKIAEYPQGMTDAERHYLLDRAREVLAKATGETLENAGRALHQAADEGEFVLQCGGQFATVAIYGRLLIVYARVELRGACHPESN